jgi:hypothetical protein
MICVAAGGLCIGMLLGFGICVVLSAPSRPAYFKPEREMPEIISSDEQ